jgi:hypothetical protein
MSTDDSVCSICREALIGTERYTSCCEHVFHYNCIHHHKLTINAKCPLCRKEIKLNKQYDATQDEKSFLHKFFNFDVKNFYVVTGIIYQIYIFLGTFFNVSSVFVSLAGLIKFKLEYHIMIYFIISLVLGSIQLLVNSRVRHTLDEYYETHDSTEYFGKTEVTNLQIIWSLLYLAMIIYTICNINNFYSNISGVEEMYLDVIIASNSCRFITSVLKAIIYFFEIYTIYERHLARPGLYAFLTVHS